MSPLPDDVRALLERRNFAHLATVLPDGAPHSVPIWVGVEGDELVFFTQTGSRKARNVERDPRVALSVEDRDDHYLQCDLRGRIVRRIDGADAHAVSDRLSERYVGEPFPWHPPTTVAYVVEVERTHLTKLPFSHP